MESDGDHRRPRGGVVYFQHIIDYWFSGPYKHFFLMLFSLIPFVLFQIDGHAGLSNIIKYTMNRYPVRDLTPLYKTSNELPGGIGRPTREKKKQCWLVGQKWAENNYTSLHKTSNKLPGGMSKKKRLCWLVGQEWAKNRYTISDPTTLHKTSNGS